MWRPSLRSMTRPASRSARRCCDTAGCETFSPFTSAVAAISESAATRSNTVRRVGSASVFITAVSCVAEGITIYKYLLICLSSNKASRKLAENRMEFARCYRIGERSHARRQGLYRRLPLRHGALRMHLRPGDGDRVQLLDLHQEGPAFYLSPAEEFSAPRRRREPEGISLQQARDPPPALHRLRRRRVRAGPKARRHRSGGGECELLRWHRPQQGRDDTDRRKESITSNRDGRSLTQGIRPSLPSFVIYGRPPVGMYGRPPVGKSFLGVCANESGSGHVYGLEMRPLTAGPDGDRGSNSNHSGAL